MFHRQTAVVCLVAAGLIGLTGCSRGSGDGAAATGGQAEAATPAASGGKAQRPGQWTVVMKIFMTGIPPEQLAQLKEAGMGGMFSGEPNTIKYCVTAESSARGMFYENGETTCDFSNKVVTPGSVSADMACPGPDLTGNGRMTITASSDKAFAGGWTIDGVDGAGNKVKQRVELTGAWVKGDCDSDAQQPS